MSGKNSYPLVSRRHLLAAGVGLLAGTGAEVIATLRSARVRGAAAGQDALIAGIDRDVIFAGRQEGVTWFHPRPCMVPGVDGPEALMTLQSISGSDVFGPVHWTTSPDLGRTWSTPAPIAGLARRGLGESWEEGTCDVVPEAHPPTRTVLAVGHNVYYKNGVLARPQRRRWPVYVVRSADGRWSTPRRLEWDDPRATAIYTCGCSQRVTKADADILIPLSFGTEDRPPRSVTTALCSFDGTDLRIRRVGNELASTAGRGLLEPSLVYLDGRYYLTIRAEDGRGYVVRLGRRAPLGAATTLVLGRRRAAGDVHDSAALAPPFGRAVPGLYPQGRGERQGDPMAVTALPGPGRSGQPAADPCNRAGRPAPDRRRHQGPQASGRDGQLPHGRRRAGGVVGDGG